MKQPKGIDDMLAHLHEFKEVLTIEYQPAGWGPASVLIWRCWMNGTDGILADTLVRAWAGRLSLLALLLTAVTPLALKESR